jgi:chromosome segregation ATPase
VIEHALYAVGGFVTAAILGLAMLPAISRRAWRLTRRELEESLPLSVREIAGERDQLRARFAVDRVRLEQAVTEAEARRQRDLAVSGIKSTEISALKAGVSARDATIAAIEKDRDGLASSLAATRMELGQTQSELAGRNSDYEQLSTHYTDLEASRQRLEARSNEQRIEIAAYQTNLEAQRTRIEELDASLKLTRTEARGIQEQLRAAQRELRENEKDRAILARRLEAADEISDRRADIIAQRDASLAELTGKTMELASLSREQQAQLKAAQRKLAALEVQIQERDESIGRIRDDGRQTAADLSKSLERLRADKQKLQGDLTDARAKAAQLQRELNQLKRAGGASDLRARPLDIAASK